MGKCGLLASLFIFDQIIIKVAGNQDSHKSLVKFEFGPNQTTHFGVTCLWVTKISYFWTWVSLKPVSQSLSNFMCSILDSGEPSLPFGLFVKVKIFVQGSKLIFDMRMYLYDTSRNIKEPWPPDLYFMVHRLWTLARLSSSKFLSTIESQDLLMKARIFHDLLTSDFDRFSVVKIFVTGTDHSKLIFYYRPYLCETSSVCFHAKGSCRGCGARGQYQSVTYISWSSDFALYLKDYFELFTYFCL